MKMKNSQLYKGSLNTIIMKLLEENGKMYGYEITQKIKGIIQSAGLSRNGKNISCLTNLRNESEHNLYSDDSYVFFDKYPSVNIFMEEIACRIVMELSGLKTC